MSPVTAALFGLCCTLLGFLARDLVRWLVPRWRPLREAYRRAAPRRDLVPQPPRNALCGVGLSSEAGPCGEPFTFIAGGERFADFRCGRGHAWRWWGPQAPLERVNSWTRIPRHDLPEVAHREGSIASEAGGPRTS